jgi:hypothetical protein
LAQEALGEGENEGRGAGGADLHSLPQEILGRCFASRDGKRVLLVINKRERSIDFNIPGSDEAEVLCIDHATDFDPPPRLA